MARAGPLADCRYNRRRATVARSAARARGPDVLRRARRAGDHRFRRGVLRRGRPRDGRVGRLADAGLQLRAALPEADPLLLAHRRDLRGDRPGPGRRRGCGRRCRVWPWCSSPPAWRAAGTTTTRRSLAGAIVATSFGYVALARMALPDLPLALCITVTIAAALVAVGDRVPRPAALVARRGAGGGARLPDQRPARRGHPGAGRRSDRRHRAAGVATAPAAISSPPRSCSSPSPLPGTWRCGGSTAPTTSTASSSATTSSDSPPIASTSRGRGGTTGRSWSAAWCRGRRSCCSASAPSAAWPPGAAAPAASRRAWRCGSSLPLRAASISVGKQPRYVLPLLPPLAMLIAHGIIERTRARRGIDGGLYRRAPDRLLQAAAIARRRDARRSPGRWCGGRSRSSSACRRWQTMTAAVLDPGRRASRWS